MVANAMRNGLEAGADGVRGHFNCAERSVDQTESIAGRVL
jgi:hypothetical protein